MSVSSSLTATFKRTFGVRFFLGSLVRDAAQTEGSNSDFRLGRRAWTAQNLRVGCMQRHPFPLLASIPQGRRGPRVFNQGESAVLFSFVFLYIAAAGPGTWSVNSRRSFVRPALVTTS